MFIFLNIQAICDIFKVSSENNTQFSTKISKHVPKFQTKLKRLDTPFSHILISFVNLRTVKPQNSSCLQIRKLQTI